MLKALIVDDKTSNIKLLEGLIKNYCPDLEVAGTATDAQEAYTRINTLHPDIVFLDIEMPGKDGFDLLHQFEQVFFETIFVTAHDRYALQAFGEQVLDYLLKPIDITALQKAVSKAAKQIKLKQGNGHMLQYLQQAQTLPDYKISLPTADGYLFINYKDITRCTASGSYTTFYMQDGQKILTSMRLKECEEQLPPTLFFRIHHSHLVNLNYIRKYVRGRGGYVLMQDGSSADVAVTRKTAFLKAMGGHPGS